MSEMRLDKKKNGSLEKAKRDGEGERQEEGRGRGREREENRAGDRWRQGRRTADS